jgi:hypothetical protein
MDFEEVNRYLIEKITAIGVVRLRKSIVDSDRSAD